MLLHSTIKFICTIFKNLFSDESNKNTLKIKLREQDSQAEQQSQAEQVHLSTPLLRSSQIRLKFV
jgi:hypothetical protein